MVFPGTVIESKNTSGKQFLDGLFVAGNIVMSQLCALTGLNTPTLQNWVNRGFLSRPQGKKYTKNQLARILIINSLRNTMKLENIKKLFVFVNGDASDKTDDIIDEAELYDRICRIVFNDNFTLNTLNASIETAVSDYEEKISGAKKRLSTSLEIICKALISAKLLKEAENVLDGIEEKNIFGKPIDN